MSAAALQLHDVGLLVVDESDLHAPAAPPSPGYALLDGETLLTGAAAMSRARLKPRFVHSRFWHELDETPLGRPFAAGLTRADLAHAHLSHVRELAGLDVDRLLLVVPGSFSAAQLGLILGIARAAGLPVAGIADSAAAAGVHPWPGERLLHLDLLLHRSVLTELTQTDAVERQRVEVGEECGLSAIRDALVRHVARLFLRDTRFDPLHAADTEQRLYDGLPYWLKRLTAEEGVDLRFESGGREHAVELRRDGLLDAVREKYESISRQVSALKPAGQPTVLLLSDHAAALPGLVARLGRIRNTRIVRLSATASAAGALLAQASIATNGEELPFLTRLPVRPGFEQAAGEDGGAIAERSASHETAGQPTHVLLGGAAYAITEEPLVLGVAIPDGARGVRIAGPVGGISRSHCSIYRRGAEVLVEDHSTHGSFLNGERVEGRSSLAVGDRLRLGSPGAELRLIEVAEPDGPAQD